MVNTRVTAGPFSVAGATLGTAAPAPPLLLSGTNVTSQLTKRQHRRPPRTARHRPAGSGRPALDEFAKTLASRLDNQGLRLFTDPAGNPPATGGTPTQSGYAGFSRTSPSTRR